MSQVEAVLLGTAQDAGVPQAGCYCEHCRLARSDAAARRWTTCLGLVDHSTRQSWLLEATPDIREQLHALREFAPDCPLAGIALTHAHMGHYAGLVHLGREAWNSQGVPVYASASMAAFLRNNAPWSQLVALDNVRLRILSAGQEVALSPSLHLLPVAVPHRNEFSDTLAFVVRGPVRKLFFCPDVDAWREWAQDLRSFVSRMDIALLDGCFFSADELPGRDLDEIPHPLVTDSAEQLAGVACDVRFIHLNHSNPLHQPGPEQDWLEEQGMHVGVRGDGWALGEAAGDGG
jgi:pyrroloquinoline quinone biosynthesis protein B